MPCHAINSMEVMIMGMRVNAKMDCVYCGKENTEQKCVIFGAPDKKDPSYGFSIGGLKGTTIKAGTCACLGCWEKAELNLKEVA